MSKNRGDKVCFETMGVEEALEWEQTNIQKCNLQMLFERMPLGMMIINEDRMIRQANPALTELFNLKKRRIAGKPIGNALRCSSSIKKGCGKGKRCSQCELKKIIEKGMTEGKYPHEITLPMTLLSNRKKTNFILKINFIQMSFKDEKQVIIMIDNITNQIKQDKKSDSKKNTADNDTGINMLKDVFTSMECGFSYQKAIYDDYGQLIDMHLTEANDTYEEMLAFSEGKITDRRLTELFAKYPEQGKKLLELYDKVLSGQAINMQEIFYETTERWYVMDIYSVQEDEIIVLTKPVDSKRKSELELRRAKKEAEAADKAKGEFLANMSHEIRTPLNGIVGMIDLTLLTELNEEQRDNLLIAKGCVDSLLKIIDDILDFSKMEAGKISIKPVNFDFIKFMDEITRIHHQIAKEKNLKLKISIDHHIPQFLIGDVYRLKQVLNNLISNAIKFTDRGKIEIKVKQTALKESNVQLEFLVEDTGIGIAKEDMHKLFKSFSQIDSSFTRQYSGSGLGLIISKQIVEMMSGKIKAKSEKGKGSIFSFTAKFKIGAAKEVKPHLPGKIEKKKCLGKILLVEDDQVNCMMVKRMLEERGYDLDTARNGTEALDLHKQKIYDAILMDIQMPDMNGLEATQKIREREGALRHTPIIALTAFALYGDRERFLAEGIDNYLAKPFTMEALFSVIESCSN